MVQFIGISGPIASGKSTLATRMIDTLNGLSIHSIKGSFATGIKYLASLQYNKDRYGLAAEYIYNLPLVADKHQLFLDKLIEAYTLFPTNEGEKNRKLLQYIGTEIGRDLINPNIWFTHLYNTVVYMQPVPKFVIVDDMRFMNESLFVNAHIQIDTFSTDELRAVYNKRLLRYSSDYTFNNHPSEQQSLSLPDFTIPVGFTPKDIITLLMEIL